VRRRMSVSRPSAAIVPAYGYPGAASEVNPQLSRRATRDGGRG
jgi:hypothetical protein